MIIRFNVNFVLFLLILVFVSSCTTDNPKLALLTDLKTKSVNSITAITARCGGFVVSENGFSIISSGVCWSLNPYPTIKDSITKDELELIQTATVIQKEFFSNLNDLQPDTTYYVRAYATNVNGTAYGQQESFRTSKSLPPTLKTNPAITTSNTSIIMSGQFTSSGGYTILSKGFCWDVTANPTISSNFKEVTTGDFVGEILNMKSGQDYYIRAYATNAIGTGYGNEIKITTPIQDIEGNTYHAVTIGTQTWMVENLKTGKYRDGVAIPYLREYSLTYSTAGWCNYDDSSSNGSTYGHLYNWFAVSDPEHNLAPVGWHIPTDAEWTVLSDYLGGIEVAGGKLKQVGTLKWKSPNLGAKDEFGFNAIPGGWAYINYGNMGFNAIWWTSTGSIDKAWARSTYYSRESLDRTFFRTVYGLSVRCVRD